MSCVTFEAPLARGTSASSRQSGFALLEALVALILVSCTLALLPGALGLARRALEQTDSLAQRDRERAGLAFLQRHLASALPVTRASEEGTRARVLFDGDAQRLRFAAALDIGTLGSGVFAVEVSLMPDVQTSGALQLVISPLDRLDGAANWGSGSDAVGAKRETRTIMSDVRRFSVRYFGRRDADALPQWHAQWLDAATLPDLVEMSLVAGDANAERRWLLTIEPKLRLP